MGKVVVKVAVWFVIFIVLLTLGLEMISAPNTIENVIGIPLWIVLIMLIASIIPFANIVEIIVFWIVWLKYYFNPEEGPYYDTWYIYWRFKDKFFSRKI